MFVNPTIAALVRQKQGMEKCQWLSVGLVFMVGLCIGVVFLSMNQGRTDSSLGVGNLLKSCPDSTNMPKSIPEIYIQTTSGYRNLTVLDRIVIVPDIPVPSKTAPVLLTNIRHFVDDRGCSHLIDDVITNGALSPDGLWGAADYDFGLPPDKALLAVGSYHKFEMPDPEIDRLPSFTAPNIVLKESPLGPNIRFLPDSVYVRGYVTFQTNGFLRFDPLPDKRPDVTDQLQEYLTDMVVRTYARTPCKPAIENGKLVEKRFRLQVFFRGTGEVEVWSNTSDVIVLTP